MSPKVPWTGSAVVTDGSVSPPPSAMLSNVAKVVQPTATVSSVPVCGPSKLTILIYLCSTKISGDL